MQFLQGENFTNATNGLTIYAELLQKLDCEFYIILHIDAQNGADYFSKEHAKEILSDPRSSLNSKITNNEVFDIHKLKSLQ